MAEQNLDGPEARVATNDRLFFDSNTMALSSSASHMALICSPLTAPYFLLDIEFTEKAAGTLGEIMTSAGETLFGGMFCRRLGVSTAELFGPCPLSADDADDDDFLTRMFDDVVGRISCTGSPLMPGRVFLELQALDEESVA